MGSDPTRILDVLTAHWQTGALAAAIDLGLFTALGRRERTVEALAGACHADRNSLLRLCDGLVSIGLLRVRSGRYRASPDAATFLDAGSPRSIAPSRGFFAGKAMRSAFADLATTVRRGRPVAAAASRASFWRDFASGTTGLRGELGLAITDAMAAHRIPVGRILDVGAGASPAGLALLRRHPTSTLVVIDRSAVARVARQQVEWHGLARRLSVITGDAAKVPWHGPYDVVLMINVLDYFGAAAQAALLHKARRALVPGGALVVHAPLKEDRRPSSSDAVAYDLMLMAIGARGQVMTYAHLKRACRRAGFARVTRARDLPLVIARTPR